MLRPVFWKNFKITWINLKFIWLSDHFHWFLTWSTLKKLFSTKVYFRTIKLKITIEQNGFQVQHLSGSWTIAYCFLTNLPVSSHQFGSARTFVQLIIVNYPITYRKKNHQKSIKFLLTGVWDQKEYVPLYYFLSA